MQPFIEAAAVVLVMLLALRASLVRRRDRLRLRGGLVALNVLSGAFAGCEAALSLGVQPFLGLAMGGLLGHLAFGALWRRLLRDGSAAARAWLRRLQFVIFGVACILLIRRLIG